VVAILEVIVDRSCCQRSRRSPPSTLGISVMLRFSTRRLMLSIAVLGMGLSGFVGLARWTSRLYDVGMRAGRLNDMRNVALALQGYQNMKNHFPAGTCPNASLPPESRLSWYFEVSPMLDIAGLHQCMDPTQAWDAAVNFPFAFEKFASIYCHQSAVFGPNGMVRTSYIGIAGLGTDSPLLPTGHPRAGIFGYDRQTALSDITDGLSTTMMVAESARVSGSWLAGGPATVRGLDPSEKPYIGSGRQFGGLHYDDCAAVAFPDGSVRLIRASIDPRVFEAISTMAGGEMLPANWEQ
jgi:hypothetical protein